MKKLIAIITILIPLFCFSQEHIEPLNYESPPDSGVIDSLKHICGYHKVIPEIFEAPVYLALSRFPEFDSTKIICKYSKIRTSLNARPTLLSLLFKNKSNRTYIIRINNSVKDSVIQPDSIPFNALIGLFGHEFCHFIDYNSKNVFGVLGRLTAYASKRSKEKYEKEIDEMTVKRGLGRQLYDWSYYVLYESDATKKYKDLKRLIYLEPDEIEQLISGKVKNISPEN